MSESRHSGFHSLISRTDPVLRIGELANRWKTGELSPAAYASSYFLLWQIALHGTRCASRKEKSFPKPPVESWLAEITTYSNEELPQFLRPCFERYQFAQVSANVPVALLAWLSADWPLTLIDSVPGPYEVLEMQARGTRPVTAVASYPALYQPILDKPNGFAFLVHDLEHAYKFYYDVRLHAGQRRLFGLLLRAVLDGIFDRYQADPVFSEKFDYLISDMNTHAVHSLKYLSATLIETLLRREKKNPTDSLSSAATNEIERLFRRLADCWGFSDIPTAAMLKLVGGRFCDADAKSLEQALLS